MPIHPELAKLLREHIEQFGYSPDGKLFTGVKGGELPTITIRRAWIAARSSVLTEKEHASPLAKRIYDLRHACRISEALREETDTSAPAGRDASPGATQDGEPPA